MSISLIENQTVRFRLLSEIEAEECDCSIKPYCQLVNKFDVTKYQILSNTIIANGYFTSDLDGWVIAKTITLEIIAVNESADGECDGSFEITASGGTSPYEYSLDSTTFQPSNLFDDLCADCYNISVRDADGNIGIETRCIETNVDCSLFSGSQTNDLLPYTTNQLLNCFTNDFI